jgi:hypothetical protein
MSVLINFDGLLKVVKPSYKETGSFNFIIGFVILGTHGFFYLLTHYARKDQIINTKEIVSFLLAMVMIVTLFGFSIGYFEAGKVVRDLFYILFFVLVYYYLAFYRTHFEKSLNSFLAASFFIYFILLNAIGLVLGNFDHEGRFVGLQMAASIYGGTACLLLIVLFESKASIMTKLFYFVIGGSFLLMSGTRGAVLSLLVYFAFAIYRAFGKQKLLQYTLVTIAFSIIAVIAIFFEQIISAMSALSSLRFISTADLEGGSLGTRMTWYLMIITDLIENNLFGGFGGGASERLTGHITHFDLLRFWYDYSLLFILFKMILFIVMIKTFTKKWLLIFSYLFVQYLLFSLHNIFQAPAMLFVFALSLMMIVMNQRSYTS